MARHSADNKEAMMMFKQGQVLFTTMMQATGKQKIPRGHELVQGKNGQMYVRKKG